MDAYLIIPIGTIAAVLVTRLFYWLKNVRSVHAGYERSDGTWVSIGFAKGKPPEGQASPSPQSVSEKNPSSIPTKPAPFSDETKRKSLESIN